MLEKDVIQTLFGYHYWANKRILECAAKLSEADYFAETDVTHGSLHEILFHMLRTDQVWHELCQNGQTSSVLDLEAVPSLANLTARWAEEERAMRQFIGDLSDDEIAAEKDVTDWQGNVHSMKLWFMLHHLMLHGQQHRSEAAALLTRYGQSPGDLDLIFYQGD